MDFNNFKLAFVGMIIILLLQNSFAQTLLLTLFDTQLVIILLDFKAVYCNLVVFGHSYIISTHPNHKICLPCQE